MQVTLLLLVLLSLQQEPRDAPTEEQTRVFAAIDKFDPLDTTTLPFVKVFTGYVDKDHPEGPRVDPLYGFLLKQDGDRFTIRYADQDTITYQRSGKATDLDRVGHEPADLAAYARKMAARFRKSDKEDRRFYLGMDGIFDPRAEALLVARACARRHLRAEVQELWESVDPVEAVKELADGFQYDLIREFANPERSWVQLRDRHRNWIESFESHDDRKQVEARVATLDQLIKEEKERAAKSAPKTPTKDEEIKGLIFELRNERWAVQAQHFDGWYLGGEPPKADGSRPSERLIKAGFDAASALIEAMSDDRFTRTVWYSSRYGGGFRVIRVGGLAEEVLESISGLNFYGDQDKRRGSWQRWRKSVAEKGEEETLAGLAAAGEDQAEQAAKRLLEKWPGRSADVLGGIRAAKEARIRVRLIGLLGPVRDAAVTDFLLEELRKGTEITPRVAAARLLLERGRREGIDLFIKEWGSPVEVRDTTQPDLPPEIMEFDRRIRRDEARRALTEFLLTSGDVQAVRAIAKDLPGASAGLRSSVIEAIRGTGLKELLRRCDDKEKPALEKEFEAILVRSLEDFYREFGTTYGSITAPRHADLAGLALAEAWPDLYPFDGTVPTRQRDRRLRGMINGWRVRNGQAALVAPPVSDARSKDPEIPRLVDRFIAERDADMRKSFGERLGAAGLGALPWIEEGLGRLPTGHAAIADLKSVARRLSNLVGGTKLETGSWKEPASIKTHLAKLQGKPLDSEGMVQLMLDAMGALPDKVGTVTLIIDRLGDGTGLHIEVSMEPGQVEDGVSGSMTYAVIVGGRSLGSTSGGGVRTCYDDASDFGDLRKNLDEALGSPHNRAFEALIKLQHH